MREEQTELWAEFLFYPWDILGENIFDIFLKKKIVALSKEYNAIWLGVFLPRAFAFSASNANSFLPEDNI